MGQILEDKTKASRERIETYQQVNPNNVENDEESQNLKEARERGDWLFIFEAAQETHHMFQGAATDRVLLYEKQKQEKDNLSKLKHVPRYFNRWITRSRTLRGS